MLRSKCMLWLLASMVIAGELAAQSTDLVVNATVDRTRIGLNEQFELTVEISGSEANAATQPELPNMDAFAAYSGSSSSQSIQIINGAMRVSRTFTYYFLARQLGSFRIEPVIVKHKGKTYKSAPIQIEIVDSRASTPPSSGAPRNGGTAVDRNDAEDLFLVAAVDKRKVYQNQPVIVEFKLYFRVQVTNYAFTNQPNYGDFWAEEFPGYEQPRVTNEMYNGVQYRVATLKKVALFPTSAGEKTIPGLELEASVRIRERRTRRDIFDAFFDDPFFGRNVAVRTASKPVTIDVMPLPGRERPANFSGAVGSFQITARTNRTHAKTNEAITLTVSITGTGNIRVVPEPEFPKPAAFEVYDPKINEIVKREDNRVTGTKSFEYLLIPRRPGNYEIPPIAFAYFDPDQQRYRIVSSRKIDLVIEKGDAPLTGAGSGLSKKEVRLLGEDIRFIAKDAGDFVPIGRRFYESLWVWLGFLIPLFAYVASLVYKAHAERLVKNPAYARSLRAQREAQRQLKAARQAMAQREVSQFYAECANALTHFIGDKLNVDASALVSEELLELLQKKGISEAILQDTRQLLAECDFRRFALPDAPNEAMAAFYERVKNAIAALEKAL